MNKFDLHFFSKYLPEWQELVNVIHTHPILILTSVFVKICLFVIFPSMFYYKSIAVQELIPFYVLEILLIGMFIKIVYEIFDWYNDVWIVTNSSVVWLERAFFKTSVDTIDYENIEWIWVEQNWIWDKMLLKWDLIIHKIWDDSFILKDAINPFKAVNTLEVTSQGHANNNNEKNEHFDTIMDALWWVVENYLETKEIKWIEEFTQEKRVEKFEKMDSTIDLR